MPQTNHSRRQPVWRTASFVLGAAVGLALGCYLEWYFNWGPAVASPDRGEAHGYWLLLAGFPITLLLSPLLTLLPGLLGRLLLIVGVGLTWGLLGAGIGGLVRTARAVRRESFR